MHFVLVAFIIIEYWLLGSILNLVLICRKRLASRHMKKILLRYFDSPWSGYSNSQLSNYASCFSHVPAALEVEALTRSYFQPGFYSSHVSATLKLETLIRSISNRESRPLDISAALLAGSWSSTVWFFSEFNASPINSNYLPWRLIKNDKLTHCSVT